MFKLFSSNIIKRTCNGCSVYKGTAVIQQRFLFRSFTKTENLPSLEPGFNIYYKGNLTSYVRLLKSLSLSTTFTAIILYYVGVTRLKLHQKSPAAFAVMSSLCGCVILSPLLINLMTRRYVIQLSFNKDTKVFNVVSLNIINRMKTTSFTIDQVKSNVNRPFTTFMVGRKPFFVDPIQFSDLSVYEYLMGYDKIKHLVDVPVPKSHKEFVEEATKKEETKRKEN